MKYCSSVLVAFILLFAFSLTLAQAPQKRELRGVWIATVDNIDWPDRLSLFNPHIQRGQFVGILDQLAAAGINAVVFQVRPACDALYASPYEPWSSWLTGTQGVAPLSFDYYDPLQFACEEAHKRGMELHAWFNPYRVRLNRFSPTLASNNVAVQHPDWGLTCSDGYMLLNPGLSQVRDHVARVISDVVRRYDIDGVHMDDYFYPYESHGFGKMDTATFRLNPMGFSYPDSLAPWRRNNVNLLIKQIYDSVQAIKPAVKFGISPPKMWKNGVPAGASGTSGYDELYCDALAWLSGKYVDYVAPQLYQASDYFNAQPWWATVTSGRHLYTGNSANVGSGGLGMQISFNRASGVQGTVIFSACNITGNSFGIMDSLKGKYYATAAVIPVMKWKDTIGPNAPANARTSVDLSNGLYQLTWDPPTPAKDGETARRYLVYRFTTPMYQTADLDVASNLLTLTGQTMIAPPSRIDGENQKYSYAVSAFDRNNNESALTNVVTVNAPITTALLASPANGEKNFIRGTALSWYRNPTNLNYLVQVSASNDFAPASIVSVVSTTDTAVSISALAPQSTYYWRVLGGNQGGTGAYSNVRSFRTGWPLPVTLVSPSSGLRNVSRRPTFVWQKGVGTSFHIQVTAVVSGTLLVDTVAPDTMLLCPIVLSPTTNYSWIVAASNAYGTGDYSAESRFQTGQDITVTDRNGEIPADFALRQNYPNPFNPSTTICYELPKATSVSLRIFNTLGALVAVLVEGYRESGYHQVRWNATVPSGIYFYRLQAGGYLETKKMLLLR